MTPAAHKLILALTAGLALSLLFVGAVAVTSVGAAASMCQRQAGEQASISPDGVPTGYTISEPSDQAVADIPPRYLEAYQRAAAEYGLDWAILAAVGKMESGHGEGGKENTCIGSYAGAQGPMQFMPATWASFGVDADGDGTKDVCNYLDSIHGAANYLAQSGAPQDYQAALFAYNNAQWYVDDVLAQAEEYRAARSAAEPSQVSSVSGAVGSDGFPDASQEESGGTGQTPNSYDLVDENRRMDYELDTLYDRNFEQAADGWNALGGVLIAPSPSPGETDVVVTDVELATQMGNTSSDGQITVDPSLMSVATDNARTSVFSHELGHALGFEHTEEDSVMNTPVITNSTENNTAPTPYDAALSREVWGSGSGAGGSNAEERVEGDAGAVFPLPGGYFDSYEDTWGASRGAGALHEGTDIFAPDGTPIYSITAGVVAQSQWNELGGWITMVEATESVGPVQAGDQLYYAHQLEPPPVEVGQTVEAGERIGKVGSSGEGPPGTLLQPASRGQHLHLGWYDPSGARAQTSSGAINPYPLLEWLRENGGTATGPVTFTPSAGGDALPPYCLAFRGLGLLGGVSEKVGKFFGGSGPGGSEEAAPLGSASAEELLSHPNFEASPGSISDLESGAIDERLIAVLLRIVEEHSIYVSAMKSDHPYGQVLPPELGGGPNSHAYGLTADVARIDGVSVAEGQTASGTLDVGNILLSIPPGERPDETIGPTDWTAELGVSREDGFITDPGFTEAHNDHLHIGYSP